MNTNWVNIKMTKIGLKIIPTLKKVFINLLLMFTKINTKYVTGS